MHLPSDHERRKTLKRRRLMSMAHRLSCIKSHLWEQRPLSLHALDTTHQNRHSQWRILHSKPMRHYKPQSCLRPTLGTRKATIQGWRPHRLRPMQPLRTIDRKFQVLHHLDRSENPPRQRRLHQKQGILDCHHILQKLLRMVTTTEKRQHQMNQKRQWWGIHGERIPGYMC